MRYVLELVQPRGVAGYLQDTRARRAHRLDGRVGPGEGLETGALGALAGDIGPEWAGCERPDAVLVARHRSGTATPLARDFDLVGIGGAEPEGDAAVGMQFGREQGRRSCRLACRTFLFRLLR